MTKVKSIKVVVDGEVKEFLGYSENTDAEHLEELVFNEVRRILNGADPKSIDTSDSCINIIT